MGQIEDLQTFVDVVNCNGIARAAASKNIAKSAVSRRIKLMEDRYGTQLIDRRPGMWKITAAGRELYQRALRLLGEAHDIETDFTQTRHSLAGPLSVSVPREFGLAFLGPTLISFVETHPEIQLTVDFDDRQVDLERENYDLAIRISENIEPDLVEQRLGETRHRLYASPNFAMTRGLPESVEDLRRFPLLHYGSARRATWEFLTAGGRQSVEFQPALNSNTGFFLLEATRNGLGIARLPDFVAAEAHAAGELLHVMPEIEFSQWRIRLVHAQNRIMNRRMRAFALAISESCEFLPQ